MRAETTESGSEGPRKFVVATSGAAAILASALVGPTRAGEIQQRELLLFDEPVISSAAKRPQPMDEAPSSVTVVTREEIRRFGYRTLADVLRAQRGFYTSYDRNYVYLGVRGFLRQGDYNDRILLLVDGHTYNDDVYQSAMIGNEFGIDLEAVERIEIVRGPGSALYGGNALFAVINVVTIAPQEADAASATAETGSYGRKRGRVAAARSFANGLSVSSRIAPFVAASDALAKDLAQAIPQAELLLFDLDGDAATGPGVMKRVEDADAAVIVSIGSLATTVALAADTKTPLVFSMVLYPSASGFLRPNRAVTGVSLDIPEEQVFDHIAALLPGKRRIGILHSDETAGVVMKAIRAGAQRGFSVVGEKVSTSAEVIEHLGSLLDRVDVLWAIADTKVFSAETTEPMILGSIRRRVPMIGLSAAQVRAGAIAAFACDHADVGRQTAAMVTKVLNGESTDSLEVEVPRRVSFTVNARTAKWLSIDLPSKVRSSAAEVVQ